MRSYLGGYEYSYYGGVNKFWSPYFRLDDLLILI